MKTSLLPTGFTLIELVIAIVVITVGLTGVLAAFNQSVRQSADPLIMKQALLIAEGMMNEILGKDFPVQTNSSGRSNYNDVTDYHGYQQIGIVDNEGTVIDGLRAYTVTVSVAAASLSQITLQSGDAKQITVTVTCGNQSISLVAFRTRYGS